MNAKIRIALFAAAGLAIVACSSADDPEAIDTAGADLTKPGPNDELPCADKECGPALKMLTILCADGSLGGNTGRCIRGIASSATANACHWEILQCPEIKPPPPLPTSKPPQPTPSPTNVTPKPPPPVPTTEPKAPAPVCKDKCGPAPLIKTTLCSDGSTAGPECLVQKDGKCGWSITECPGK